MQNDKKLINNKIKKRIKHLPIMQKKNRARLRSMLLLILLFLCLTLLYEA